MARRRDSGGTATGDNMFSPNSMQANALTQRRNPGGPMPGGPEVGGGPVPGPTPPTGAWDPSTNSAEPGGIAGSAGNKGLPDMQPPVPPMQPITPPGASPRMPNLANVMGVDVNKFNDPNKKDFKYDTMRTLSGFDPKQGFTPEVIAALNKLDYGTFSGSGDKLGLTGAKNSPDAADFDPQDWIYAMKAQNGDTKWNFGGGGAGGGGGVSMRSPDSFDPFTAAAMQGGGGPPQMDGHSLMVGPDGSMAHVPVDGIEAALRLGAKHHGRS